MLVLYPRARGPDKHAAVAVGHIPADAAQTAAQGVAAALVLAALALVSVLGIGGAKLKGVYRETAEIYTSAQDEYGHSIQGDFEAQADAAANLIKQAGYVDSTPAAALQEAEDALATWNDTDDSPAVQYAANRRLYNAVDTLYASLNNKVDDSTQRALDDQYNAFVSAQATIERAANVYNLWVEDYEKTVSQFPANLISGLWGAQAPERFATK